MSAVLAGAPGRHPRKERFATRRLMWRTATIIVGLSGAIAPVAVPSAQAEPYGSTDAERQYLAQADQYLQRPRPNDKMALELGYQACAVRRGGGSSDAAKVAIWKMWDSFGIREAAGAEVGSLVHLAVDNLCPEVGYP